MVGPSSRALSFGNWDIRKPLVAPQAVDPGRSADVVRANGNRIWRVLRRPCRPRAAKRCAPRCVSRSMYDCHSKIRINPCSRGRECALAAASGDSRTWPSNHFRLGLVSSRAVGRATLHYPLQCEASVPSVGQTAFVIRIVISRIFALTTSSSPDRSNADANDSRSEGSLRRFCFLYESCGMHADLSNYGCCQWRW